MLQLPLSQPQKQRFDAAFQKTKLAEAATDGSSHVVFHRQIGLRHDAKVTSNSHRANQGTANTELPGVEMGTPSAGRAPKKLRLLRIKTESIRSHPLRDLLNSQLHQQYMCATDTSALLNLWSANYLWSANILPGGQRAKAIIYF